MTNSNLTFPDYFAHRYRVERILGSGENGTVFLVRDILQHDRLLALKRFHPGSISESAFHSTAKHLRAIQKLKCDGLLTAIEFGFDQHSQFFYTSEYCAHPSLEEEWWNLTNPEKIIVLYDLADIMLSLHDHQALHYHLHPRNVFINLSNLRSDNRQGKTVLIGDYCFLPEEKISGGCAGYRAPEFVNDQKFDHKSDIFSFGVIGYSLLMQLPPDLSTLADNINSFSTSDAEMVSNNMIDNLSKLLVSQLFRCMNPVPNFRPYDFREIISIFQYSRQRPDCNEKLIVSFPFTGRSGELRFLGSILHDTKQGEQWAVNIFGSKGVGKSRLIDEFAFNYQFNGGIALFVGSSLIDTLKRFNPNLSSSETDRQLTNQAMHQHFSDTLISITDHKPIVICWNQFDRADTASITLFKELLLLYPSLPIFWLLESELPALSLDGLGFTDRVIRRELLPFSMEEVEKLLQNVFPRTEHTGNLAKLLSTHFGTRPGWFEYAINRLISNRAISNNFGRWEIDIGLTQKLLHEDGELVRVDLSKLSQDAQTLLEWMAGRSKPCRKEELQSAISLTESGYFSATNQLLKIGLIEIHGPVLNIRYSAVRDEIIRCLSENKRKVLHSWIGRWLEENISNTPKQSELWEIVKHYYEGSDRSSFLRVIEELIARFYRKPSLIIDTEIILKALLEQDSPLQMENQYRGYYLLGLLYIFTEKFEKAVWVYRTVLSTKAFKPYYTLYWAHNMLGQALYAMQDFASADRNFRLAIRLNKSQSIDELPQSLRALATICHNRAKYDAGIEYIEKYYQSIQQIEDLNRKYDELFRCGRLYYMYNIREKAVELLQEVYNCTQYTSSFMRHISYDTIIKITMMKGEFRLALQMLQKYLMQHNDPLPSNLQYKFDYTRILCYISTGKADQCWLLVDTYQVQIKIYLNVSSRLLISIDLVQLFYYFGKFQSGLKVLREVFLLFRVSKHHSNLPIYLAWVAQYFYLIKPSKPKFYELIDRYLIKNKSQTTATFGNQIMYDLYCDLNQPIRAKAALERIPRKVGMKDVDIPDELIVAMQFRMEIELTKPQSIDEPKYSEIEKSVRNLADVFNQVQLYRELMNAAIVQTAISLADRYFHRALELLLYVKADLLIAQLYEKYGSALYRWNRSPVGADYLSKAKRILIGLGMPYRGIDPQNIENISVNGDDEMSRMIEPLRMITRLVERFNELDDPRTIMRQLLETTVTGLNAKIGWVIQLNKNNQLSKNGMIATDSGALHDDLLELGSKTLNLNEAKYIEQFTRINDRSDSTSNYGICLLPISTRGIRSGVLLVEFAQIHEFNSEEKCVLELVAQIFGSMFTFENQLEMTRKDTSLTQSVLLNDGYSELKGNSPAMQEVYRILALLRKQDLPVLILGESGTGKELVANIMYRQSNRSDKPFYALNCAAFPDTLIESQLFGHVKGAFSGAMSNHDGFFKTAEVGTIFLDEVNHMSPMMQGKLLRVLQEGEYFPVGSTKVQKTNARIICAAKNTLPEMLRSGQFREDLFYRINVIEVKIPPLRDRKEDIKILAEYFIQKFNKQFSASVKGIRNTAMQSLQSYSWPGNVRQLENAIRHSFLFVKKNTWIDASHLPQEVVQNTLPLIDQSISLTKKIEDLERQYLLQALELSHWNNSEAARILGVSRQTVIQKIKRYGLSQSNT